MKIARFLRSVCYRSYRTAELYEALKSRRGLRRKAPVVVYQMGKVGSVTVHRSLSACPQIAPLHIHFLSHARIRWKLKKHARLFPQTHVIPPHLCDSLFLRRHLDLGRMDHRWKIVTLIRDPLARTLSAFFQTMPQEHRDYGFDHKLETMTPEALVVDLAPIFERWAETYISPEAWLNEELKGVFGLDVLAREFPVEESYGIYEEGRLPVLLIKLERLDDCASRAFQEFLGLREFTLIRGNEAASKKYAPVYRAFRELQIVPEAQLERIYGSDLVRRFYSEAEIAAFRQRWSPRKRPYA